MISNPAASRTLDPTGLSLASVVGVHDRRLSDSELNLIQSLQDYKRQQVLGNQVCSGALTFAPFTFTARSTAAVARSFTVPAFNVLMNGDVVTVGGNNSATLDQNVVTVPAPIFWSPGSSAPQASLYVAYVEFWYARLNPTTGQGYSLDPATGIQYHYPNGCVNAPAAAIALAPSTDVDPFQGQVTAERVQLQWAIRVAPVGLDYDFNQFNFGLDPGAAVDQILYGQGTQSAPSGAAPYQFTNLASITGDAGLWRSGDGNLYNELGTLDGYSYAMPLAVIFQRNTGSYSVDGNPFGTVDPLVAGSGFLASGWTARFDGKYADVVFPEDVVDTRSLVSLTGWDSKKLVKEGFVDVISGRSRAALARGETPGNLQTAAGSLLDYTVTVGPNSIANTDTVGAFDGYRNGFSAATQTFYSTRMLNVNNKAVGVVGGPWLQSDGFTLSLPGTSQATIEYLSVQALVDDTVNSVKTPVLLLPGQITVTGLGTQTVTVQIAKNLTGTSYDPGQNPMYLTVGVQYPADGGVDLVKIPNIIYGGRLVDAVSGRTLPVFGVSDYAVQAMVETVNTGAALAYNPNYSNLIFGTRVQTAVPGSAGVASISIGGSTITTFTVPRTGLPGNLTGLYVVAAVNQATGAAYTISGRTVSGTNFLLQLDGAIAASATVVLTFLAANTAQLSFSAPVKAVTAIEETVLAGTVADVNLLADPRIAVISVKNYAGNYNSVVLATTGGTLTGIAGDDVNKLIFVRDTNGNYNAVQVASAIFANGFVTLTVPPTVNLEVQTFFLVCALNPAFSAASTLALVENYVPYQGEGRVSRDYELVHTEAIALITTNGTGTAPVPGLSDIYPYNRELPISTTLPSQVVWSESSLLNQPVASVFDSNYVAKLNNNIEHTFEVPVHTNDFIELVADGKRKSFQLSTASGSRGFAKAIPHMGFAITPVTAKKTLGVNVTSTSGAVALYVNNVSGNDNSDGLSTATPFKTIAAALSSLPSVLADPCTVQLMPTGQAYSVAANSTALQVAVLGDGVIRATKYYALGLLCSTIQGSGRLVITAQAGTTELVTLDGTGFTGYGDGPTSAFFVESSRVIFNQIEFKGFSDPAVKGINANVEFVDCAFTSNTQAASFEQASSVILTGGTVTMGAAGTGFVMSQSGLTVSGTDLAVIAGSAPGAFFVVERGSSVTLDDHALTDESNVVAATLIAQAELNSSIVVTGAFTSAGSAAISQNSVLSRSVSISPFVGGVTQDTSSNVATSV